MSISDVERATTCLHRVGYYRLSGYSYPFRHREIVKDSQGVPLERTLDTFRAHTDFGTIMDLYVFDKRLRLLFLDAIERIEIGLRVEIALLLGKKGAYAYRELRTFNAYFSKSDPETGLKNHEKWLSKLDDEFARSREDFAEHFRKTYQGPLPIWMSIEVWDFGSLAKVLSGLLPEDLDDLGKLFGLQEPKRLISWTQSINFVRNVCAHHGRLWNRPLIQQPSPGRVGEIPLLQHLIGDSLAERRLYAVAVVLQYFMRYIHPGSTWGARLKSHLESMPASPHLSVRHMGFRDRWHEQDIWR